MPSRELDQFEIEDFCRDYGTPFFYFIYFPKLINKNKSFHKEIDGYMEISVKKDIMVKETIE